MTAASASLLLFSRTWNIWFFTNTNRCHLNLVCCSLQARGFVNYYGPQRFGSGQSVQSDRVGLALLKEDMVSVETTVMYQMLLPFMLWKEAEQQLVPQNVGITDHMNQKEEQCHRPIRLHSTVLSVCVVMYVVVCWSDGCCASLLHSRGRRWSSEPREETLPANRWEWGQHWPFSVSIVQKKVMWKLLPKNFSTGIEFLF